MRRPLRFATYLAPNAWPVYLAVARAVGRALGVPTELRIGAGYDRFASGEEDVGFVCGLAYVKIADRGDASVEPIAAPVLRAPRYAGRPIYFSDVIVARSHPAARFEDLAGASWAYNERDSQSGYGITRAKLAEIGATEGFFGRVAETGLHQRSIDLVAAGEVDASAIDSQVLEIEVRRRPELAERFRVVDALGPSTIQPVVASTRLAPALRRAVREAILAVADDPLALPGLRAGLVDRFAAIGDGDYDDIRAMMSRSSDAGLEGFGRELGCTPAMTLRRDDDKEMV